MGNVPVPVFEDAVVTGARTLGDKMDLRVVFQGENAYTDGSTVVLPALRHDAELTQEQVGITRGYWYHEAAHIRYTDMAAYAAANRRAQTRGDELFPAVLNALEDGRIESLWLKEFPGAFNPLSTVHEVVDRHALDQLTKDPANGGDFMVIGPMAITWVSGEDKAYIGAERVKCVAAIHPAIWQQAQAWYSLGKACQTTAEVVTLAEQVTQYMRHNPRPPAQQMPGAGQGQAPGTGAGAGNGQGIGQGGTGPGGKSVEDASKLADTSDKSGGAAGSGPISPSLNIKDALGDAVAPARGGAHHRPFSTAEDKFVTRTSGGKYGRMLASMDGDAHFRSLEASVRGRLAVMRRKIERGLMGSQARDWVGGNTRGRLDSRVLAKAFQGQEAVYKLREQAPEIDTAVQIIVDGSSSMIGREIQLAALTAVALVMTLETVGARSEVIGFPGNHEPGSAGMRQAVATEGGRLCAAGDSFGRHFSRAHPVQWTVHKAFDEKVHQARRSLGMLLALPSGGTPLTDCIYGSMLRIHRRPEQRRIMIVVTDGQPDSPNTAKVALRQVARMGVTVVGVGIGDDFIGQFCERSVVVRQVTDLATSVMDDMAKLLLGERFHADNGRIGRRGA